SLRVPSLEVVFHRRTVEAAGPLDRLAGPGVHPLTRAHARGAVGLERGLAFVYRQAGLAGGDVQPVDAALAHLDHAGRRLDAEVGIRPKVPGVQDGAPRPEAEHDPLAARARLVGDVVDLAAAVEPQGGAG